MAGRDQVEETKSIVEKLRDLGRVELQSNGHNYRAWGKFYSVGEAELFEI